METKEEILRKFVQSARDLAAETTDNEVKKSANILADDPRSVIKFNYALGLRDGVIMACDQILAKMVDQFGSSKE